MRGNSIDRFFKLKRLASGNSAERSLWITFYIKTKDNYRITFPIYNLLTRVESPLAATDNRIRPDLLTSNSYYLKE
ncbi:hypothetical protein MAL08_07735 [Leptospira noguchii]|uniref:hypothetical protein n=1 Tax=Leptospira noguchii TaxID=28182 RepID=UPI00034CDF67|nr:hypothetical protein [Leptospira noguchii]UOG39151.1 hypothetical protein MAL08_07735 [Leptospira noguchii]